jgi:endonuclease/exonuclease/phosphatase (EEP) superfamily protein YafD
LAVAAVGLVMLSQAVGWDGATPVAAAHALTPYLVVVVVVGAGLSLWRKWHELGVVSSLVGVAMLLLAAPIVFPPAQARADPDAASLRVGAVNLLYRNDRTLDVADDLATRDLDVIVFSEYTAEHQAVLLSHELATMLPHREDRDGLFAGGVAVWSRFPVRPDVPPDTINYSVDLTVDGPDGPVRVFAVHPPTPVFDFDDWRRDLDLIGEVADRPGPPTLVIGDFNASYWHPVFRRLLHRGLTDAHMALGAGWSTSWPTDRWFPPFVRLDHALTGNGLVSTDIEDFQVPGSDHAGLVVTVSPTR